MAQVISGTRLTVEAEVRAQPNSCGELWCTKWHRDIFFSEYFGLLLPVLFFQRSVRLQSHFKHKDKSAKPGILQQNLTKQRIIHKGSNIVILGTFAYSQKVIISFVMSFLPSVTLSSCIKQAPTGQVFVKFDIGDFHENLPNNHRFC